MVSYEYPLLYTWDPTPPLRLSSPLEHQLLSEVPEFTICPLWAYFSLFLYWAPKHLLWHGISFIEAAAAAAAKDNGTRVERARELSNPSNPTLRTRWPRAGLGHRNRYRDRWMRLGVNVERLAEGVEKGVARLQWLSKLLSWFRQLERAKRMKGRERERALIR